MDDFAVFIGNTFAVMYPNPVLMGVIIAAMVGLLLIKTQQPAPVVVMMSFSVFAVIVGFSTLGVTLAAISPLFLPILILITILIGGAVAYALWRMFSQ